MLRYRRNKTNLILEELQNIKTLLYDCSIDLKIEIPRIDDINTDIIFKTTLTTIVLKFLSNHEEFRPIIDSLYGILKETLAASKRNWNILSKNRKLLTKNGERAGHIVQSFDLNNPPVVHDIITFSEKIVNDSERFGLVNIECHLEIFLSPAICAGKDIYTEHNFPLDANSIESENVKYIIDNWCCKIEQNELQEKFKFPDIWRWVVYGVDEYEDYWRVKRARYVTTSEDDDDEEDDHNELDEDDEMFRKRRNTDICFLA